MAFGLVSKQALLNNVNTLLAAGNLPTLGDLAENARQASSNLVGQANTLTTQALNKLKVAQTKHDQVVKEADVALSEAQTDVSADLTAAAALNDQADKLAAAADYFTK